MEKIATGHIQKFSDPRQILGAAYVEGEGVYIRLWAPYIRSAQIEWAGKETSNLEKENNGYFTGHFPSAKDGDRYFFICDGKRVPDPATRFQPEGVFGPSQVYSPAYSWKDQNWSPPPREEWVIYEIHTGTFSEKHSFLGIIDDLPRLKELGITALEIMPVSQFTGERNWGYDGVFPHSVHNTYGGPQGFKELIDAAHATGLAVILDVVYNHIGPEGNVLFQLAPYTQQKYKTPWGEALNYDGEFSDEVRRYFLQSVWQWLTEYHLDGLRLDAVQTILDVSPVSFLQEVALLKKKAEEVTGRPFVLIAETDMNDSRLLDPVEKNGFGFDGHWADDLHHALHATLTGEKTGYYADYGGVEQIARIFERGVAYEGNYSPFRKRAHGRSYEGYDKRCLVVQSQNHDQIGNRLLGERLSTLVDFEKLKLTAACILLSSSMPLLFMGEELATENPFLYFINHSDPKLVEAVHEGRRKEWASFGWSTTPPNAADPDTFEKCVLKDKNPVPLSNAFVMQHYYKSLIDLSKKLRKMTLSVLHDEGQKQIILQYKKPDLEIRIILSFNDADTNYNTGTEEWSRIMASNLYQQDQEIPSAFTIRDTLSIAPFSALIIERQ